MSRIWIPFIALALATSISCDSYNTSSPAKTGGSKTGGKATGGSGGSGSGGTPSSGGATSSSGGSGGTASTGGAAGSASGGAPVSGGNTTSGGAASGGAVSNGGSAGGGSTSDAPVASGGSAATGGASTSGGAAAGGAAAGGSTTPSTSPSELIGWATEAGGTTGGGNATPIVVKTIAELNTHAAGKDPKVIHVDGKLTGLVTVGSNKTIIGLKGAEINSDQGVLVLTSSENVIIQNLKLVGRPANKKDNSVLTNVKHIWLDHLEFVDGQPDLLKIKEGSDFITISWCKFRFTTTAHEHMGSNIAIADSEVAAKDHMNITYHHNWWSDNVNERMPRVRFGKVHVFNSLFVATPTWIPYYAIRAGFDANIRTEKNIFKDFKGASWYLGAPSTVFNYAFGSPASVLQSIDDVFVNCTERAIDADKVEGGTFSKGTAFVPPYKYTPDPTDGLEAAIRAGAGATK